MIEVFIDNRPYRSGLDFYLVDKNEFDGKRYILRQGKYNFSLEEITEHAELTEPTFHLGEKAGLEFMKSMAEKAAAMGIKLDSDLKREGKLEAVQAHLEDMRKLVFK